MPHIECMIPHVVFTRYAWTTFYSYESCLSLGRGDPFNGSPKMEPKQKLVEPNNLLVEPNTFSTMVPK